MTAALLWTAPVRLPGVRKPTYRVVLAHVPYGSDAAMTVAFNHVILTRGSDYSWDGATLIFSSFEVHPGDNVTVDFGVRE